MLDHRCLFLILSLLLLSASGACVNADKHTSKRLIFNIAASREDQTLSVSSSRALKRYIISAKGSAFFNQQGETELDSAFAPLNLTITINLLGELTESLLNLNGYRVQTQLELKGGDIAIDHTNQASLIVTPEGDTLYAIRGEGIVSGGTPPFFENISGFFFEESTYKISPDTSADGAPPQVININTRYELIVDF